MPEARRKPSSKHQRSELELFSESGRLERSSPKPGRKLMDVGTHLPRGAEEYPNSGHATRNISHKTEIQQRSRTTSYCTQTTSTAANSRRHGQHGTSGGDSSKELPVDMTFAPDGSDGLFASSSSHQGSSDSALMGSVGRRRERHRQGIDNVSSPEEMQRRAKDTAVERRSRKVEHRQSRRTTESHRFSAVSDSQAPVDAARSPSESKGASMGSGYKKGVLMGSIGVASDESVGRGSSDYFSSRAQRQDAPWQLSDATSRRGRGTKCDTAESCPPSQSSSSVGFQANSPIPSVLETSAASPVCSIFQPNAERRFIGAGLASEIEQTASTEFRSLQSHGMNLGLQMDVLRRNEYRFSQPSSVNRGFFTGEPTWATQQSQDWGGMSSLMHATELTSRSSLDSDSVMQMREMDESDCQLARASTDIQLPGNDPLLSARPSPRPRCVSIGFQVDGVETDPILKGRGGLLRPNPVPSFDKACHCDGFWMPGARTRYGEIVISYAALHVFPSVDVGVSCGSGIIAGVPGSKAAASAKSIGLQCGPSELNFPSADRDIGVRDYPILVRKRSGG